ncbi:MAG TPA: thiol-disulfide oxidoreductase DCC family protein [Polyangiaceae bacterium]|nr:thiol-disulfide oxidoreductase DCC family protein [Polyangiaceae bacterium]
MQHSVVLFDGVCNLCSGAVRFIAERDPEGIFRFASLQSDVGRQLLRDHGVEPAEGEPDTIVLIDHGRAFERSTAALHIARRLGGPYRLLFVIGSLVPRFLRDLVYDFVARHRYRWFGKKDACMVPTPELRARFL